MTNLRRTIPAVALVMIVATLPAAAEVFTITLATGEVFETRYQPLQSATDEGKIQLLTETGLWISLLKEHVTSVASETESRGFGTVIDSQTISLGWDPTSLEVAQEAAEAADPTTQLLEYLRARDQAEQQPVFNNRQFVEPEELGGIPIWMTSTTTPPLGGTGRQ
jgi:hypothetical protein